VVTFMQKQRSAGPTSPQPSPAEEVALDVTFDQLQGWKRDSTLKLGGAQLVGRGAGGPVPGLLQGMPWDVQLELFGNCGGLCSTATPRDKEVFCLFSLTSYSGMGAFHQSSHRPFDRRPSDPAC
jgi:hypothetical protein